jgi:pimeloyl-ACP methyl ester carboxylesterase
MSQIILIPGLLCDRALWRDQIPALSNIGEVTVPDITRQRTITEMANDVLNSVAGRFSLAGFSLGGQVALEIMRLAPQRVERLALLSTTHGGLTPAVAAAIAKAVPMLEQGKLDEYLLAAYPTYVAPSNRADHALWQAFADMAHRVGGPAGVRQMESLLSIAGPFKNLESISCPTMVIGGREDGRATPAVQQQLAQEIPGSKLVSIENSGHFTPLEQSARVAEVLAQWMRQAGSAAASAGQNRP